MKLLRPDEVADLLQVKITTIYTWVKDGKLPSIRIGNTIRFDEQKIIEYLQQQGEKNERTT